MHTSQLEIIELLHQECSGFTVFIKKESDKTKTIGAIESRNALNIYHHKAYLDNNRDVYFSLNTFQRVRPFTTKYGLPYSERKERNLSHLRALYLDLDIYRLTEKTTEEECINKIQALCHANALPKPSIYARSGRGVYCLWLIQPQKATAETIKRYKEVNKAIHNAVIKNAPEMAGAVDPIYDAARVLRLPGSINSKCSINTVTYALAPSSKIHSLDSLCEFFAIKEKILCAPPTLPPAHIPKIKDAAKAMYGKMGGQIGIRSLGIRRFHDLLLISASTPIKKGFRYNTLRMLAAAAKIARISPANAINILTGISHRFSPAYPSESNDMPIMDLVAMVYGHQNIRYTGPGIAKFFGLSTTDCKRLFLRTVFTEEIKHERARPKRVSKSEVARILSAIYVAEIEPKGGTRGIAADMREKHGIKISHTSVAKYLKSNGIKLKPGRPKKHL